MSIHFRLLSAIIDVQINCKLIHVNIFYFSILFHNVATFGGNQILSSLWLLKIFSCPRNRPSSIAASGCLIYLACPKVAAVYSCLRRRDKDISSPLRCSDLFTLLDILFCLTEDISMNIKAFEQNTISVPRRN